MPLTLDGNGDIVGLATGALEAAAIGAGAIRQVVSATYGTSTSTTSSSFVDLGLSATITPTSSSSKILAIACLSCIYKNGTNSSVGVNIVRTSTEIVKFSENTLSYTGGTGASGVSATMTYLDSPATTSATTYKIQFKKDRKSTRLNSSHVSESRMPSSA